MTSTKAARVLAILAVGLLVGSCSDAAVELPPCEGDCPELVVELDPSEVPVAPAPDGQTRVNVGVFVSVEATDPLPTVDRDRVARDIADLVDNTNEHMGICDIAVVLEAAVVIALPESLLFIQGNEPGSYGGHPPEEVDNIEQFNYDQNETLTSETRKLFEFGKAFTSANAISAFTVRHIEYYAGGLETSEGASALSFPPNSYHRSEDYPARNSVLLIPDFVPTDPLPARLGVQPLFHELGHMLLNRGDHPIGLGEGGRYSAEECATMRQNVEVLYGDEQVVDPGRPGG